MHFSATTPQQRGRGDFYADDKGNERLATLNERLDVGLFAANPGDVRCAREQIHPTQLLAIRRGDQTVRIIAKRKLHYAGVGPYLTLFDRNTNDNILSVTTGRR